MVDANTFNARVQAFRSDVSGFSPGAFVGVLIGVLIAVIVGFALFPTLLSSVSSVNATSKYASGSAIPGLLNLSPLFWVLGVVIASIAIVFVALRSGMGDG